MTTNASQPGILAPPPALGRSLTFQLAPGADPREALRRVRDGFLLDRGVVGLGELVTRALGADVTGLRTFPGLSGPAVTVPSTQQALWVFLRGADRSALFDLTGHVTALVDGVFLLDDAMDTFMYAGGRDLTGYEDGTENPRDDAAAEAALVSAGEGLTGSSFVAVQRWAHDLRRFRGFSPDRRDAVIGRRVDTNAEIVGSREAQRAGELRPAGVHGATLHALGDRPRTGARVHRVPRMVGLEDGVVDALFTFSRLVTGGYYWCPPVAGGRLDLRRLAL
jgi:putative iron-dependent peroxidase